MSDTRALLKEIIAIARKVEGETRERAIEVAFRLMDKIVEEEHARYPLRVPESHRKLRHTAKDESET